MTTPRQGRYDYNQFTVAYYVVDVLARGFFKLIRLLPYRVRIPAAGWLNRMVLGPLFGVNRRIRENLLYVRPEISRAEVKRITAAVCDNFGRLLFESQSVNGFLTYARAAELKGPGLKTLMKAVKLGRPVILISGHFGNYQVVRVLLGALGHNVAGMYRPLNNGYMNRHYISHLGKIAGPNFSRGSQGTRKWLKHLKTEGTVSMLIDQHANRGERLKFMGKPAWTMLSAAEIALKYDALLVPCFNYRKPDGMNFEVVIEAPIAPSTAPEMIQEFNDLLEKRIWENPGQWFWIHRRWKNQDK